MPTLEVCKYVCKLSLSGWCEINVCVKPPIYIYIYIYRSIFHHYNKHTYIHLEQFFFICCCCSILYWWHNCHLTRQSNISHSYSNIYSNFTKYIARTKKTKTNLDDFIWMKYWSLGWCDVKLKQSNLIFII